MRDFYSSNENEFDKLPQLEVCYCLLDTALLVQTSLPKKLLHLAFFDKIYPESNGSWMQLLNLLKNPKSKRRFGNKPSISFLKEIRKKGHRQKNYIWFEKCDRL